ncbi:hypothetical protein N8654_00970 [Synechococcus sp. AH-601-B19]|nr:hypothetical protein [Synechococcus sp. AH-601-B19]
MIGGADRCAYSYKASSHKGSWKKHLLEELGDFQGRDRVHLTRPYITSWSLFEAAACNTPLAISKGPATQGILEENSVAWVDLNNTEDLVTTLNQSLKETQRKQSKLQPGFELTHALNQWQNLLNQTLRANPLRQADRATALTTELSTSRDG